MRRLLASLAIVGVLSLQSGCGTIKAATRWLVTEQLLGLEPARVEAQGGKPLAEQTPDELKANVAAIVGEEPKSIEVVKDPDGKPLAIKVTLSAPLKAAAEAGGNSLASKIAENPTAAGIPAAGIAALLGFWAFIQRRRKLS